jgi:hypothetical protein
MRPPIDSSTHVANANGKPGAAHGFGRIPRADSRTVAHAATDTNTVTATNTTPHIIPHSVAVA